MHSDAAAGPSSGALDTLESFVSTARQLSRELNAVLAEDGLREETWRAMRLLAQRPGLLMGEIAEGLTISNATATRVINDLADGGLAFRRPGDDDGRKAVVFLSRIGVDRLTRVDALVEARVRMPRERGWNPAGLGVG